MKYSELKLSIKTVSKVNLPKVNLIDGYQNHDEDVCKTKAYMANVHC